MIFAAGLGTRLKPLTDNLPKALIPVAGKPLLEHVILKLKKAGFDEIIVNVHHFADLIIDFLHQNNNFGIRIEVSDERTELLDTGGGIKKAAWFFDDGKPFLVHNVDILSNLDLNAFYNQSVATNALATLVVSHRDTYRYLMFNRQQRLCGWINERTDEVKPADFNRNLAYTKLAFAGIQVLSPSIFDVMEKYEPKFPIMSFYLENAKERQINGFVPENFKMLDVGKLNALKEAELFVESDTN